MDLLEGKVSLHKIRFFPPHDISVACSPLFHRTSRLVALITTLSLSLKLSPKGVGKTSIAKSIASSLNRKFYRFSVGNLSSDMIEMNLNGCYRRAD
jgi:hypothetical protein